MCFSMLQKLRWRKRAALPAQSPPASAVPGAVHGGEGRGDPSPARQRPWLLPGGLRAAAVPTISPHATYSGRIYKYTLKCTPGWGPACLNSSWSPPTWANIFGQWVHVNMELPSLACPSNLSCSSAWGWSQDLSLGTTALPMVPLWTPPALLTCCRRTYLWRSALLVNVTHNDWQT